MHKVAKYMLDMYVAGKPPQQSVYLVMKFVEHLS